MKCSKCGKEIEKDDIFELLVCSDCLQAEIKWHFRNNPKIKEDIKFMIDKNGVIKEELIFTGMSPSDKKAMLKLCEKFGYAKRIKQFK